LPFLLLFMFFLFLFDAFLFFFFLFDAFLFFFFLFDAILFFFLLFNFFFLLFFSGSAPAPRATLEDSISSESSLSSSSSDIAAAMATMTRSPKVTRMALELMMMR